MANGLYAGSPQQYYGMKRRTPSYNPIIQAQSGLPMYALKEMEEKEKAEQTRHEEEISLAKANIEQAKKELASFEKYQSQGIDLSKESLALQESLSKYQTDVQKSIAKRESEQRAAEAKKAQLMSGLQTGVQAVGTGYKIGSAMGLWGKTGATTLGAGAAGAGAGGAAGGAYGSGSLGYGGVALGSSGAGAGGAGVGAGPTAAGAGAGATASVAGPLAGAVMLKYTHQPVEWTMKKITGGWWGRGKEYSPNEWERRMDWVQSGGAAARDAAAPLMPYNVGPSRREWDYLNLKDPPVVTRGRSVAQDVAKPGCIIVSSCTDPNSYEVNITREFRDNHLDPITLKGYYELAKHIVPLINKSEQFKRYIKETLVDRLIDFGEWVMGYKDRLRFKDSETVTRNFLNTCYLMGA